MKAVILAAGMNFLGELKNPKPKCLYHVDGEVLLERIVRVCREAGVDDVRVVVGWKKEEIEKFNRERNLGLELVYNPDWYTDSVMSLITGVKDVDDDVLIICADLLLRRDVVEGLIRCKEPFCCTRGGPPRTDVFPWGARTNESSLCKVSRERLHVLRDAQKYSEMRRKRKHGGKGDWTGWKSRQGVAFGGALVEIFEQFKHEVGGTTGVYVLDVDSYQLTDEAKDFNFTKKGRAKNVGYADMVADLPHWGHIRFLKSCKSQCDYLIVGIDTDEQVTLNKRSPVIPYDKRVEVVKAITYVDEVRTNRVWDDVSVTMKELVSEGYNLKYWFHGDDHVDPNGVEYIESIGGQAIITPYVKGISTKEIIHRILERGKIK